MPWFGSGKKPNKLEVEELYEEYGALAEHYDSRRRYIRKEQSNLLQRHAMHNEWVHYLFPTDYCKAKAFNLLFIRCGAEFGVWYTITNVIVMAMIRAKRRIPYFMFTTNLSPVIGMSAAMGVYCYCGILDQQMCHWRKVNDSSKNTPNPEHKPLDSNLPTFLRFISVARMTDHTADALSAEHRKF